jgi:hypothetical protein
MTRGGEDGVHEHVLYVIAPKRGYLLRHIQARTKGVLYGASAIPGTPQSR